MSFLVLKAPHARGFIYVSFHASLNFKIFLETNACIRRVEWIYFHCLSVKTGIIIFPNIFTKTRNNVI